MEQYVLVSLRAVSGTFVVDLGYSGVFLKVFHCSNLGSAVHFGVTLHRFGLTLGTLWVHCWARLDRFGIVFRVTLVVIGSTLAPLWIPFVCSVDVAAIYHVRCLRHLQCVPQQLRVRTNLLFLLPHSSPMAREVVDVTPRPRVWFVWTMEVFQAKLLEVPLP